MICWVHESNGGLGTGSEDLRRGIETAGGDSLKRDGRRFTPVYVLELAGSHDAFAVREAGSAGSGVEVLAPGLALATDVDRDRVEGLAYTRRVSELVGRCEPSVDRARSILEAVALSPDSPEGPSTPKGTAAVRGRDVRGTTGVDTRVVERELGAVLEARGFGIDLDDPDHELRALFSEETCALGWLAAESRREFGERRPTDRPFFQPGSMAPLLARALANIAGARPEVRILDPMCGTGGVLVEAGLVGAAVLGVDAQWKMVRGTGTNLDHYLTGDWSACRGDATRIPIRDDTVDGVVFDAPYGRQSKIAGRPLAELVEVALAESRRVSTGPAVVVGDRSWTDAARDAGWTVESTFERRVHRSLTRHILVLE